MKLSPKLCLFALLLAQASLAGDQDSLIINIDAYHNNSKWQKASSVELIDQFMAKYPLKGNESIIDLCSGDGKVSAYLSAQVEHGQVTGIDWSSEMVSFAERKYGSHNLRFMQKDIQLLDDDSAYDLATSFTCLHLVPNIRSTFYGIEKSLKPGGLVLMQFPFDHGLRYALNDVVSSDRWRPYFTHYKNPWYFHTPDVYEQAVKASGLSPIRIEINQKHEVYLSRAEFSASLVNWLPHVAHLAEPLRVDFMRDLLDSYTKYMPEDENGYVHYFVDRIEIEAQKPL